MKHDHSWLEPHSKMLKDKVVLELGCGPGLDTSVIAKLSKCVISGDLAPQSDIKGSTLTLDHSKALPFRNDSFDTVVASLCLHYFRFDHTKIIIEEISRVLTPQGNMICRLNSYKDENYGAVGYPEIEPGLYNVNGKQKRFFQEKEIHMLWANRYSLNKIAHKSIDRYQKMKYIYEFSATRR